MKILEATAVTVSGDPSNSAAVEIKLATGSFDATAVGEIETVYAFREGKGISTLYVVAGHYTTSEGTVTLLRETLVPYNSMVHYKKGEVDTYKVYKQGTPSWA